MYQICTLGALNVLSWNVALSHTHTQYARLYTHTHTHLLHSTSNYNTTTHSRYITSVIVVIYTSMGIVGVNSTAGREVKFIDPSKTTKSESS